MFVQKNCQKDQVYLSTFIPVNTKFNQFLSKLSSVYTGSHFSKFPIAEKYDSLFQKRCWEMEYPKQHKNLTGCKNFNNTMKK